MSPRVALVIAVVTVLAAAVGAVAYYRAQRRRPCPHCGKRSPRIPESLGPKSAVLRPGATLYRCPECNGRMRYARGPNRREYWEPVREPKEVG